MTSFRQHCEMKCQVSGVPLWPSRCGRRHQRSCPAQVSGRQQQDAFVYELADSSLTGADNEEIHKSKEGSGHECTMRAASGSEHQYTRSAATTTSRQRSPCTRPHDRSVVSGVRGKTASFDQYKRDMSRVPTDHQAQSQHAVATVRTTINLGGMGTQRPRQSRYTIAGVMASNTESVALGMMAEPRCNADIQQMIGLIVNTKDVKGTDKEAKAQKEHGPTAGKSGTANSRLKRHAQQQGK